MQFANGGTVKDRVQSGGFGLGGGLETQIYL